MIRPQRLWDQHVGKIQAELLRGCGIIPMQEEPCELEPPFCPFDRNHLTAWDCLMNGWEGPFAGNLLDRAFASKQPIHRQGDPFFLQPAPYDTNNTDCLVPIIVEQYVEDETTIPRSEQLLLSLSHLSRPVAFEIYGQGPQPDYDFDKYQEIMEAKSRGEDRSYDEAIIGWTNPEIVAQFVTHKHEAHHVQSQLLVHYPNSAVTIDPNSPTLSHQADPLHGVGGTLALNGIYCFPLRTFTRLDPDPLGVVIAAMERLDRWDWALLQILFQPARYPWAQNIEAATCDPYQQGKCYLEANEMRLVREKQRSPLFAVVINLMASRTHVFRQLVGWAEQFANPPHQSFFVNDVDWADGKMQDFESSKLWWAALARCSHRAGMLFNAQELSSLVHIPSEAIVSERLRRVKARTRPVKESTETGDSVILGVNVHQGVERKAHISPALRPRHTYIAGASGTGKSTLLLNLILQDISAGRGVGVLDPHGDLINAVLGRVPAHRVDDVILFDPSDTDYPFGLNILDAKDENERERIVSETIMAFSRYFPASWGPRLEHILTYTIHTVLDAIPHATLADVEQMLVDDEFRHDVIERCRDPRFVSFWEKQFCFFPKNAVDPVLNKLSPFLLNRTVRNIICQRRGTVDFDQVLNSGKIFLANLSTGLLTEKIAGMFGSFLVTKIVNAAFRRAKLPEEQRRPWYLYVDEFQAFMNLSVGFDRILAEARKYKLVLAGLANQYVGQLTPEVRQAIFGNVGTFVVFRLGVDDANVVAKELGPFTADEILNLELGEAFARIGGSATSFNLRTYPEPEPPDVDPSSVVFSRTRKRYSRKRSDVEKALAGMCPAASGFSKAIPSPPHAKTKPSHKSNSNQESRQRPTSTSPASFPTDPLEDDFVT